MAYGFGPNSGTASRSSFDTDIVKTPLSLGLRFWFQADTADAPDEQPIFGKRLPGGGSVYFSFSGNAGALFFWYDYLKADGNRDMLLWRFFTDSAAAKAGAWYALRLYLGKLIDPLVSNKDGRVYINGIDSGAGDNAGSSPETGSKVQLDGSNKIRIGTVQTRFGNDISLYGKLAEWALYDYAPDNNTLALWSTSHHPLNSTQGLLAYYPLKDDLVNWKSSAAGENSTGMTKLTSHPILTATPNPLPTPPAPPSPPDPRYIVRSQAIGNSLTYMNSELVGSTRETILAAELPGAQNLTNITIAMGRPLEWHAANPTGGQELTTFGASRGLWQAAFANFSDFDQVVLQLFQNSVGAEATAAVKILTAAKVKNPNAQPFLYETWPGQDLNNRAIHTKAFFNTKYNETVIPTTYPFDMSRAFSLEFKRLVDAGSGMKPLLLIPALGAMKRFNDACPVGRFNSAWDLYDDAVHLNKFGIHLCVLAWTAVQNRINPIGTALPPGMDLNAAETLALQKAVADEVKGNALTGVTTFYDDAVSVPATAPTASLVGAIANITAASSSPKTFAVQYKVTTAGAKIAAITIGAGDIAVTSGAKTLSAAPTGTYTDAETIDVTYSIAAPAGGWSAADNGIWTVSLASDQVKDTTPTSVAAGSLGTFSIAIPLGETLIATPVGVYTDAETIDVTYSIAAPAGGWKQASNGSWTIRIAANQVKDTAGTFAAAANLATLNVNVPPPAAAVPPTASLAPLGIITAPNSAPVIASVTYTDSNAGGVIAAASLGAADITVSKGSEILIVTLSGSYSNQASLTVNYTIAPPTGGWTHNQNGVWTISAVAGQVSNTLGLFIAAGTLGTLNVNIVAPVPTPIPTTPVTDSEYLVYIQSKFNALTPNNAQATLTAAKAAAVARGKTPKDIIDAWAATIQIFVNGV